MPLVDLDTDSDNNGVVNQSSGEEAIEMTNPGKVVAYNKDDDNANGFGRGNDRDPGILKGRGKLADRLAKRRRGRQQRRDVPEHDARLGEVGNAADVVFECDSAHFAESGEVAASGASGVRSCSPASASFSSSAAPGSS